MKRHEPKFHVKSEPRIKLTQEQIEQAMSAIAYIRAKEKEKEKEMAEKAVAAAAVEEVKPSAKSSDDGAACSTAGP